MSMFIVPSRTDEPNDWVALDPKTYELIDRAPTLAELAKKVDKTKVLFTTNWYRPIRIDKKD